MGLSFVLLSNKLKATGSYLAGSRGQVLLEALLSFLILLSFLYLLQNLYQESDRSIEKARLSNKQKATK